MSESLRTPSDEQRSVIDADYNRFAVTAAAGAGKTFVLVERYLRHVEAENLRPDEILTITFTRKAAAEMKKRIVDELRSRNRFAEAQIAETGPIQTIHSFCERLLRENALEAGLDPGFDILSEADTATLTSACVREALASDLDDAPQAEALISYVSGMRREQGGGSPYEVLEGAIADVLDQLRAGGIGYDPLMARHASPEELAEAWEEAIIADLPERVRSKLQPGPNLQARLYQAFNAAKVQRPKWVRTPWDDAVETQALEHTCGLVQLALSAWWRLRREMDRRQALDFTELEALAVRLLEGSEATRERVKRQYKVAMVDEAQDVNPMQYRLLRKLDIEREMLVGDAQQSIYGFRFADLEQFHRHVSQTEQLRLSKNYRSDSGILSFIDLLFLRIWEKNYKRMHDGGNPFDPDKVVSIDCRGVELWRHPAKDTAVTAGYIQQLVDEGVAKSDIAVLVRDARFAADLLARLEERGVAARIVGGSQRFYARLEIRDMANALRAIADPFDDFSLLACLHSPVVGLSIDSVVLLGMAPRVAERLSEFEAPTEEDAERLRAFLRWYEPLRLVGDRLSAWEAMARVLASSDFLPTLARRPRSDQLLANVRKLLSLAASQPELGPLEYAERIREIQDLRHNEGDAPVEEEGADVVTLMTIHKSKGLEFPVVVVPQTDKPLGGNPKDLAIDAQLGLAATKFGQTPQCLMHRWLSDRKRDKEEQEELRVLYVALTRAKSRLCICVYPPRGRKTLSKAIGDAIGSQPPPGVRVRAPEAAEDP
jgi:ATP-dependent helicase/nuclease subunit A